MKWLAILFLGIVAFGVLSPAQGRRIEINPFATVHNLEASAGLIFRF